MHTFTSDQILQINRHYVNYFSLSILYFEVLKCRKHHPSRLPTAISTLLRGFADWNSVPCLLRNPRRPHRSLQYFRHLPAGNRKGRQGCRPVGRTPETGPGSVSVYHELFLRHLRKCLGPHRSRRDFHIPGRNYRHACPKKRFRFKEYVPREAA